MTESEVIWLLAHWPEHTIRYELMIPNTYVVPDCESDLFCIRKSGFCDEFEVKLSRADFLADKKKGVRCELTPEERAEIDWTKINWKNKAERPGNKTKYDALEQGILPINYFWYVTPAEVIDIDDLPDFAGWILVTEDNELRVIKKPKRLHRNKMSFENRYKVAKKIGYRYWLMWRPEV